MLALAPELCALSRECSFVSVRLTGNNWEFRLPLHFESVVIYKMYLIGFQKSVLIIYNDNVANISTYNVIQSGESLDDVSTEILYMAARILFKSRDQMILWDHFQVKLGLPIKTDPLFVSLTTKNKYQLPWHCIAKSVILENDIYSIFHCLIYFACANDEGNPAWRHMVSSLVTNQIYW